MQGCTPLHTAADTEKAESVRLLLTYGADVGAVDKQVSFGPTVPDLCCMQIEMCDGTVICSISAARHITRLIVELMPTSGVFRFALRFNSYLFSSASRLLHSESAQSRHCTQCGHGLMGQA